jgi:hypothetical protein
MTRYMFALPRFASEDRFHRNSAVASICQVQCGEVVPAFRTSGAPEPNNKKGPRTTEFEARSASFGIEIGKLTFGPMAEKLQRQVDGMPNPIGTRLKQNKLVIYTRTKIAVVFQVPADLLELRFAILSYANDAQSVRLSRCQQICDDKS